MKNLLCLLIIVILNPSLGFSQVDSLKSRNKLNISIHSFYTLSPYSYNFTRNALFFNMFSKEAITFQEIEPSVSIQKGNHSFFLGPKFWIWNKNSFYKDWKTSGFRLTYQWHLNKKILKCNPHLFYDISFARFSKNQIIDYNSSIYPLNGKLTQIQNHINNVIGVGLSYSLFNQFILHSDIGFGLHLFQNNEKLEMPNDPSNSFQRNGNFFSYGEMTSLVRLGIGYKFN